MATPFLCADVLCWHQNRAKARCAEWVPRTICYSLMPVSLTANVVAAPSAGVCPEMKSRSNSLLSNFCAPFLALVFVLSTAFAAELPTIPLRINGHKLTAEIADTFATRSTGLMHRFSLKPDHGMLFVFRQPESQAFWMKNTFVALSIAYIDDKGRIVNIEDMAPQTENTHPSSGPAMYALEMKKGWFNERAIGAGAVVVGLAKAPPARE